MTPALRDTQSDGADSSCPRRALHVMGDPGPAPGEPPACQWESEGGLGGEWGGRCVIIFGREGLSG